LAPSARSSKSQAQGFILQPARPAAEGARPWVWYAPTIELSNQSNEWVLRKLLDHDLRVWRGRGRIVRQPGGAESSTQFHQYAVRNLSLIQGKVAAQSRVADVDNWAAENPDKSAALPASIPCAICEVTRTEKRGGGVWLTPTELKNTDATQPDRSTGTAGAGGRADSPHPRQRGHGVPLEKNSQSYWTAIPRWEEDETLCRPRQGARGNPGYFQEPRLVQFLIDGG